MSTMIRVVTRKPRFADSNLANPAETEVESTKDIDHDNFDDRKWLANHCWWAMRSSRSVTTYPIKEA